MKQDLALRALNMAIAIRRPPPGCVHQTDRGSQYCAHDYQKLLRKHGFKVSMSGKGNCYDRAILRHWFKHNGEVRCRKLLQVAEGRIDLAAQLANPPRRRSRPLPLSWFAYKPLPGNGIHQRLLQSAPETLSPRLEITRGFRTESRLT